MSGFAQALREKDDFYPEDYPFFERDTGYHSEFINQYIKIPDSISNKVEERYGTEKTAVKHCIKLLISNLLAQGRIAYSEDTHYYSGHRTKYYTYAHMMSAVKVLIKDKIAIQTFKGRRTKGFVKGISSRLNPTDKVNLEFPLDKVSYEIDLKTLPLLVIDKKPILSIGQINPAKTPRYINTPINTYNSHAYTCYTHTTPSSPYHTFFHESEVLNRDFFNHIKLDFSGLELSKDYLECVGLTRIFNDGECGRWFQKGGYSYQQLSEDERSKLRINGYEVAELDYSAMHPNLLYTWENIQAPTDLYGEVLSILNLNPDDKFAVKKTILLSINAGSFKSLSSAINADKRDEGEANKTRIREGRKSKPILYDELKRLQLKPKMIVDAFSGVHPRIAKYIYSASANALMLAESNIMTAVLFELMKNNIPALPVHDSVIFPQKHKSAVKQVMLDCYKNQTGFDIDVK